MLLLQVLTDVTAVEFITFMRILSSLPSMNTLIGRQQLLDIVTEQADLSSPFDVRHFFIKTAYQSVSYETTNCLMLA